MQLCQVKNNSNYIQMKKTLLLFFIILIGVAGCRKDTLIIDTTGSLVVNARDGAGTSLIGRTVYLYDNHADFNNSIYSQTRITDNSGQVRFDYLTPSEYYFECDFTNTYGQIITISGYSSVYEGNETTFTLMP